jgi:hypothetical protein
MRQKNNARETSTLSLLPITSAVDARAAARMRGRRSAAATDSSTATIDAKDYRSC